MRSFIWLAAALTAGLGFAPRATAPREAAPQPAAPEAASPDAGADRLYRRNCASCHGDDFTGSVWREFRPEIPDFTSAAWHAKRSDARLLASVLNGAGSGMPAFRRKLSEEQARALVARLRRAAPTFVPGQRPDAEPDDFHSSFEELEGEMNRLKKEFHEATRKNEPGQDGPQRADE